jgi:hypothetical protein
VASRAAPCTQKKMTKSSNNQMIYLLKRTGKSRW